jgi:hypothetical protein
MSKLCSLSLANQNFTDNVRYLLFIRGSYGTGTYHTLPVSTVLTSQSQEGLQISTCYRYEITLFQYRTGYQRQAGFTFYCELSGEVKKIPQVPVRHSPHPHAPRAMLTVYEEHFFHATNRVSQCYSVLF